MKEIKGINIGKEGRNKILFADDMILFMENAKEFNKTIRTNKFSRLLEYRWECKNQLYFYVLCYAKSLQSCPTLCDPIDGSPPGFPVPGILQARTLEWVAISCSNAWRWKEKVKSLNRVRLLAPPWTAAHQAPPSMGFSKQEYWSGVPLPSPFYVLVMNNPKPKLGNQFRL